MKYFIFRNVTIEPFWGHLDAVFSGYEDISQIDETAERYVWFYLPPVADNVAIAEKIRYYADLLCVAVDKLSQEKMFILCTMRNVFSVQSIISDRMIDSAIQAYNSTLYDLAVSNRNIKVIDFAHFLDDFKQEELLDWRYYFISQMGLNPRMIGDFVLWWNVRIRAIEMKRKKCLILDFDNTLWGGILGEDGVDGIALGGDYPGNSFLLFQHLILELSNQGVILAVCSKNNMEDVLQLWKKHPDLVLKEEHFAAMRINWNNKADNIRELSQELNLGYDSFVFLDDSPSERELVKRLLPEVIVPDFPEQPYLLPAFFKTIAEQYFSGYALTDEDRYKTAQYKTNAQRTQVRQSFTNMDEYIRYLEIELTIAEVTDLSLTRAAQMTQKTNQFNLTTRRYTETDLCRKITTGSRIFTLSVHDRFGDSGTTGLCIVDIKGNLANIDSLLLSCRILGKDIEKAFLAYILKTLQSQGIEEVMAEYIPTEKNMQTKDFYEKVGFLPVNEENRYKLVLSTTIIKLSNNYKFKSI